MINVLELRKNLGWSQVKLAAHIGSNQATICRLEKGGPMPGPLRILLSRLQSDFDAGLIQPDPPRTPGKRPDPAINDLTGRIADLESAIVEMSGLLKAQAGPRNSDGGRGQ